MATFSTTEIGTYRRCRQKWDFESKTRKNLTGIGSGVEALELGGLIHRALADWITVKDPDKVQLEDIFHAHAFSRENEIRKSFVEKTGREIQDENLESLHNVIKLGMAMSKNYQDYHKTPLPKHMKFAMPEQEVIVDVPGTEHQCEVCYRRYVDSGFQPLQFYNDITEFVKFSDCTKCGGTGVVCHKLSMTLDGLIQDKNDLLFVLEHKTYEHRPQLIDLNMNDQFKKYCWGVSRLGVGTVGGVAYDGMWKREKPPKYMQLERRAGKMSDLFIRKTLEKDSMELKATGITLAKEINEMASNPLIYPNVPWQGCRSEKCQWLDPCNMLQLGEDPTKLIEMRYTQRETIVRGGQVTR